MYKEITVLLLSGLMLAAVQPSIRLQIHQSLSTILQFVLMVTEEQLMLP